jgi:methionyl-tRNA formyltransferase
MDIIRRVIFLGSPAEVIPPLKALLDDSGVKVVAVVTQPSRPAGRGGQMTDPPVAVFARERGIPTLQPESAKDPEFLSALSALEPDIAITAAYGQILTRRFLEIPKRATINIHPSLLPRWRGATPVPASLMAGETETGVTILFTVRKLDAGDIIIQNRYAIESNETAGALTERLFQRGAEMLPEALRKLDDSWFGGSPQDPNLVTFCGKIDKANGQVRWNSTSSEIVNRYRAFEPWPGSFTFLAGKRIVLGDIRLQNDAFSHAPSPSLPGTIDFDKRSGRIVVATGDGTVTIGRFKPAGGKDIDASSFWNAVKSKGGGQFTSMDPITRETP